MFHVSFVSRALLRLKNLPAEWLRGRLLLIKRWFSYSVISYCARAWSYPRASCPWSRERASRRTGLRWRRWCRRGRRWTSDRSRWIMGSVLSLIKANNMRIKTVMHITGGRFFCNIDSSDITKEPSPCYTEVISASVFRLAFEINRLKTIYFWLILREKHKIIG